MAIFLLQYIQVKEPTTVNYDSINNNLETMSSDADGLQKLARYALAAGSVMNSKDTSAASDDGEADREANEQAMQVINLHNRNLSLSI